jgi:hypothetical protein
MFSAVPSVSGHIFMFCTPEMVSAVPMVTGPVFMFSAPGLFFGGTEGVGSRFKFLRSRTRF